MYHTCENIRPQPGSNNFSSVIFYKYVTSLRFLLPSLSFSANPKIKCSEFQGLRTFIKKSIYLQSVNLF